MGTNHDGFVTLTSESCPTSRENLFLKIKNSSRKIMAIRPSPVSTNDVHPGDSLKTLKKYYTCVVLLMLPLTWHDTTLHTSSPQLLWNLVESSGCSQNRSLIYCTQPLPADNENFICQWTSNNLELYPHNRQYSALEMVKLTLKNFQPFEIILQHFFLKVV